MAAAPSLPLVAELRPRTEFWEADPYRLWGLLEMLRFYAASFVRANDLVSVSLANFARGQIDQQEWRDHLVEGLNDLHDACVEAKMPAHVIDVSSRLRNQANSTQEHSLITSVLELQRAITLELTSRYFVQIHKQRRSFYEQDSPPFGDAVARQFSEATRDISDAARCLALEQWTATVFHLMRVLEIGLRRFSDMINVPFKGDIELENWKNIIDQLEKHIKSLEQTLPKGPEKDNDLRFYASAASQFWHFKNAWRNHVSHSRATYDERDAVMIWNSVREFMTAIATRGGA